MKSIYFAIALFVAVPAASRSQDAPPTPQKPSTPADARQRSASDEQVNVDQARREEVRARQSVDQANLALRRAAQRQELGTATPDGPAGAEVYLKGLGAAKLQKGAWLGVSASSPPAALRRQLKLPDGTGLVVDFVQPKSPAEQAGIKQYDLLVKLNDQLLVNAEQLAVLVRTYKPGEEVRLSYFREGERQTSGVKLVERDLPPLSDFRFQYDLKMDPKGESFAPVRILPPGAGGGGSAVGGTSNRGLAPDAPAVERSERTLTWLDGKRQITVGIGDDQKMVKVIDAQTGRVIYEGPLDFSDRQRAVSREVRDVLDRLRIFLKSQMNDSDASPKKDAGQ